MKAANDQLREIKKLRREESTLSPTQLTRLNPLCQKYSRGSSSVGSFRNRRGRLPYPCSPDVPSGRRNCFPWGKVCHCHALKSFVLFLNVFQVIDDKTVTNKVSLNFHFLLPLVTSLKIYKRIPFKNLRALSLSLRSQL